MDRFVISPLCEHLLMLQLMVVFRTIFYFNPNLRGYSLIAVFIAFAINYAAYFVEIYRGGIEIHASRSV